MLLYDAGTGEMMTDDMLFYAMKHTSSNNRGGTLYLLRCRERPVTPA